MTEVFIYRIDSQTMSNKGVSRNSSFPDRVLRLFFIAEVLPERFAEPGRQNLKLSQAYPFATYLYCTQNWDYSIPVPSVKCTLLQFWLIRLCLIRIGIWYKWVVLNRSFEIWTRSYNSLVPVNDPKQLFTDLKFQTNKWDLRGGAVSEYDSISNLPAGN